MVKRPFITRSTDALKFRDQIPINSRGHTDQGTHFTVLTDRGFGKTELYECCAMLGLDYVIRFRELILVADAEGNQGYAKEYLLPNGRPRMRNSAQVTGKKVPVPAVVVTKAKKMQEPWCIATARAKRSR